MWRDRRPANAPELTALQRAILAASEEAETARASAERKRLEEMAAAQAARETALAEAEAAQRREAGALAARDVVQKQAVVHTEHAKQQARLVARRTKFGLCAVSLFALVASAFPSNARKLSIGTFEQLALATSMQCATWALCTLTRTEVLRVSGTSRPQQVETFLQCVGMNACTAARKVQEAQVQ
jgi:hypothetical protein